MKKVFFLFMLLIFFIFGNVSVFADPHPVPKAYMDNPSILIDKIPIKEINLELINLPFKMILHNCNIFIRGF